MKFAVENFKIFKERQEFDIRPITILVGPNGSGKSSVIRGIELLNNFPAIVEDERVDEYLFERFKILDLSQTGLRASSFDELTCKNSKSSNLIFDVISVGNSITPACKFRLHYSPSKNISSQATLEQIEIFEISTGIKLFEAKKIGKKYSHSYSCSRIKEIIKFDDRNTGIFLERDKNFMILNPDANKEFIENESYYLELLSDTITNANELSFALNKISFGFSLNGVIDEILEKEDLIKMPTITIKIIESKINIVAKVKEFMTGLLLGFVLQIRDYQQYTFVSTNRYLNRRYLDIGSDKFHSTELQKLVGLYLGLDKNERETVFNNLVAGLNKIGFAKNVSIVEEEQTKTVFIKVFKSGQWIGLESEGYGIISSFSVLLAIALGHNQVENGLKKIEYEVEAQDYDGLPYYATLESSIVVIEEPEMNLHPSAQSKLADVFADSVNNHNTTLILETHSEYLIRKFQYLVAKKVLKPEQIQIYYFYPEGEVPEGEKKVYPINIEEDGSLTKNFGKGFFDEAGNLDILLYQQNRARKN